MELKDLIGKRILLLDGATGVELRKHVPDENSARGRRFMTHPRPLLSNLDILNLSRPEVVASVHDSYLEAGADIIETNTFNSNALSQREYGTDRLVRDLNLAGARIAVRRARHYSALDPARPRFVAGSMGPTAFSASFPCDSSCQWKRAVDFATLADIYADQAEALVEGGVDMLLIETAYDLLNIRGALHGASRGMERAGRIVPVAVSLTISDTSGRILSGHTPEAVLAAVAPYSPVALGFNCSAGPAGLASAVRRLADASPFPVIFYPNAGLPGPDGAYDVDPDKFVAELRPLLDKGLLCIVGGCCGTTPEHIARLSEFLSASGLKPRPAGARHLPAWLSGLEAFGGDTGFINVGERCNVAGSRKFLRLVAGGDAAGALDVARRQVEAGAMILDINMDDPMLDAPEEMQRFLRLLGSDPTASSVPWMIDSSDFKVMERALENMAGRGIVNSISLRDGEEDFIRKASIVRRFGAAVVVMLTDERGQAADFDRKIEIARRAVAILTDKCGFDPRDIIIDANVLTVATGMPEHDRHALDFLKAVEWIRGNLPGVRTSGGLSNLSFSFRGNNYIRQAMHAVFLFHAVRAGLDMAIMDPGMRLTYSDIEPELLDRIEDVILCRRPDAASRLIDIASRYSDRKVTDAQVVATVARTPSERISAALIAGDTTTLVGGLDEVVAEAGSASAVVDGPLMDAMEEVGRRFEAGKMFLPQVVKSAAAMQSAVAYLRPMLEQGRNNDAGNGLFLLATVRGDVHDIGKNIAGVVLRCNNFEVVDLGVQVDAAKIVGEALRLRPRFIGLSGLITPSLEEMAVVAAALKEAGIDVPLFVGGAATSELHTALRIAPAYGGVVVRVGDASANPVAALRLIRDYEDEAARIRARQRKLVEEYQSGRGDAVGATPSTRSAMTGRDAVAASVSDELPVPSFTGVRTLPPVTLSEIRPFINYTYFYKCWNVRPGSREADALLADAEDMLDSLEAQGASMTAQVAFYGAYSEGDFIKAAGESIYTPRQNSVADGTPGKALSDYVAPEGAGDHIGCFLVTVGETIRTRLEEYAGSDDSYSRLLLQSLADRLAEAASEWLHRQTRVSLWGYSPDEPLDYQAIRRGEYRGIRPAVGYPSLPDQRLMHTLMRLLRPDDAGVSVTVNGALSPSASVAGFYLASPRARYFMVSPSPTDYKDL